jgi:hypothetical protein
MNRKALAILAALLCCARAANAQGIWVSDDTGETRLAHVYNAAGTLLHFAMDETNGRYLADEDQLVDGDYDGDGDSDGPGIDDGVFLWVVNGHATSIDTAEWPRWSGTIEMRDGAEVTASSLAAEIAEIEAGAAPIPVNQVAVPKSRTWTVNRTSEGLEGELTVGASIGEGEQVFAIDFANDLPTNGRVVDFLSIEPYYEDEEDEPEDPIATFADAEGELGVDKSRAIVKITPETIGTVTLKATVSYGDQQGGAPAVAFVVLKVRR